MSIIVFYIDHVTGQPRAPKFTDLQLMEALAEAEKRRREGHSHVTISSEMSTCVTKPGVASVENGKTPDGEDYGWRKRR